MKPTANLYYELNVKCPDCKKWFDIIDKNDDDRNISKALFNNKWDELKGMDVICDYCDHEFKIGKVEY